MTEDKGILIKNIYYMFAYAFQELRQNNYEDIAGEDFNNAYDLFTEILQRGVSYQLKRVLHRRYINKTDDTYTLRGKLGINGTIRNYANCRHSLYCEFDEYSEDNIFNRILKATIELLIKQPSVNHKRKSALLKLRPFFSNVSDIELKYIKWDQLRFDRNSATYRMLMYLCYFISKDILISTDSGTYRMPAFSDEHMCRLYEKFILEYYRRHHPELKATAKQIRWNLAKDSSSDSDVLPVMQTDVFMTIGERTLIIDAKYYAQSMSRHFDKAIIHQSNLYQIHSYILNHDTMHTGRTDGMLLYAKTQEQIVPDGKVTLADGNNIFFRSLDLNQDFTNIKLQLDNIVKTIQQKGS